MPLLISKKHSILFGGHVYGQRLFHLALPVSFSMLLEIYNNVKGCVRLNNTKSAYFNCNTVFDKGEAYLNDLESLFIPRP